MVRSVVIFFVTALISTSIMAKEIKVAVGLSLPPYVIKADNSGIELEIVRKALAHKGHTLSVSYFANDQHRKKMFSDKKVDMQMTLNESSGLKGFYSDSHISYIDYAVSLKQNNVKVNSIADLGNYSVVSYQGANKYVGPEFTKMTKVNKRYKERESEDQKIKMLFGRRIQVFVGDKNIFLYTLKNTKVKIDRSKELVYHDIFPPLVYKTLYHDQQIRDDFNEGLKALKESGEYDRIYNKYLK